LKKNGFSKKKWTNCQTLNQISLFSGETWSFEPIHSQTT
jgi:hypothetical protein